MCLDILNVIARLECMSLARKFSFVFIELFFVRVIQAMHTLFVNLKAPGAGAAFRSSPPARSVNFSIPLPEALSVSLSTKLKLFWLA